MLLAPAALFAEYEAAVTISSPTQTLPSTVEFDAPANISIAYGIYDRAGLTNGLPSTLSIQVSNLSDDYNNAYGYRFNNYDAPSVTVLGDLMANTTISATNSSPTGEGIGFFVNGITGSAPLVISQIGGVHHITASSGEGMRLERVTASLIRADITVNGHESAIGVNCSAGTSIGEFSGNITTSGIMSMGLAYASVGTISGNILSTGYLAYGVLLDYEDSNDCLQHVSGSIEAVSDYEGSGYVSAAIMRGSAGDSTSQTVNVVTLGDGANISATNVADKRNAFAIMDGRGNARIRLVGESGAGTFHMAGGLLFKGGTTGATLSLENGTYLWSNLQTHAEGTEFDELGVSAGELAVTITDDAKVVLLDDANL